MNCNRLIIFFLLFILVSIYSCSKENGPGDIQGKVLNITTDEPIAMATVYLMESHGSSGVIWADGGGASIGLPIAETRSDENGEFSFFLEMDEDISYYVSAKKDLYSVGGNYEEEVESHTVIFYLQPPGMLNCTSEMLNPQMIIIRSHLTQLN